MAFPRFIIALFAVMVTLAFAHPVSDCAKTCYKKALGLTECHQYVNHAECLCDSSNIEVFNECNKICSSDGQLSVSTPQQACKHVAWDINDTLSVTAIAARTPHPDAEASTVLRHIWRTMGFRGPLGVPCMVENSDADAQGNDEVATNQVSAITAIAARTPHPDVEVSTALLHTWRTIGFCGPPGVPCFGVDKVDEDTAPMPMSPSSTEVAYAKAQPAASSAVAMPSLKEPRPFSSISAGSLPTMAPEKRQGRDISGLPLRNTKTLIGSAASAHGPSLSMRAAGWTIALVVFGVMGTLILI